MPDRAAPILSSPSTNLSTAAASIGSETSTDWMVL